MFQKILVPTDFSDCSLEALKHATGLCRAFAAELCLLNVSPSWELESEERHHSLIPDLKTETKMQEQLLQCDTQGLSITKVQVRGVVVPRSVEEYAKAYGSELIIMGTHGRHGFKHWLLGSVAEDLVRCAPCPVISVKQNWQGPYLDQVRNLLVPLDFSLASRTALRKARAIANKLNARIQVLHVIEPPPYPDIYAYSSNADFYDKARAKSEEVLSNLISEEGPQVQSIAHVVSGHPAREILAFASANNSDLILMAHLGISRIHERGLGSVTEHIVRAATCPVFTADLDG